LAIFSSGTSYDEAKGSISSMDDCYEENKEIFFLSGKKENL